MPAANQQLAALFQEMADAMQVLGMDGFRALAFARVARALDDYPHDLAAIGPDTAKLQEIPGVGKGSAQRIAEFLTTGKIKEHDELMAQGPSGLAELLRLSGMGPKTVALLWKEAGVTTVEDFLTKLNAGKLVGIKGLGEKKLDALRRSVEFTRTAGQRIRIGQAMPLARHLVDRLREVPRVGAVEFAGSLRRGKETIGDVDLIVAANPADAPAIGNAFVKLDVVAQVLAHGPTKCSIRTAGPSGGGGDDAAGGGAVQVDLRIVHPDSFGAALMYFTGSKEHNVALRERAIKRGLKLNEYGLFKGTDSGGDGNGKEATHEKVVASNTEEDTEQKPKTSGVHEIAADYRRAKQSYRQAKRDRDVPILKAAWDARQALLDYAFTNLVNEVCWVDLSAHELSGDELEDIERRLIVEFKYSETHPRPLLNKDEGSNANMPDRLVWLFETCRDVARSPKTTWLPCAPGPREERWGPRAAQRISLKKAPRNSQGIYFFRPFDSGPHGVAKGYIGIAGKDKKKQKRGIRGRLENHFNPRREDNFPDRILEVIERQVQRDTHLQSANAERVAGKTEAEVYKALDLDWIPPELREDRDEIELAQRHALPKLVQLDDIKAELHAHTTASDGQFTIRELALLAIDRGFHTIAITDHSVSQVIANGLNAQRLEEHIQAVREVARELKDRITVLAGSEVDIRADGSLDYPNSVLKELDLVIASPHSALSQPGPKATARLIKAIRNPYVTILGHPTGRLIGRREGLSPDIHDLAAATAERGVALEINANSYRLDLRDTHARAALEAGVKLAINTDAHSPSDLEQLLYGVMTARRAGATAENIVNCLSRPDLAKWLAGTRS